MDSHIMKVVQQIVSQSHGSHQIIVRDVGTDESPSVSDFGDTITIATPESLTEQMAMTLASAIGDGTIFTTPTTEGAMEVQHATVTMVAAEDVELLQQEEQYLIASPEDMEIQTVVVVWNKGQRRNFHELWEMQCAMELFIILCRLKWRTFFSFLAYGSSLFSQYALMSWIFTNTLHLKGGKLLSFDFLNGANLIIALGPRLFLQPLGYV